MKNLLLLFFLTTLNQGVVLNQANAKCLLKILMKNALKYDTVDTDFELLQ